MVLDPLQTLDPTDLPDYDADQEYGALLRALRRQEGFGIIFVRCSPERGQKLVAELQADLPRKRCEVLTLTKSLPEGDFFGQATAFLAAHPADVLFVSGLEHSVLDYEETKRQSGWTAAESRGYSWKGVPPILRNLNQQRDQFRNQLGTCFVFLVPLFLVRYLTRRAPDFFDWRSGVFEFQNDVAAIEQELIECRIDDPSKIKELSEAERIQRAIGIKDLLNNPQIQPDQRFRLLYDLGLLQRENGDYESCNKSWLKSLETDVVNAENYYLKGGLLALLKRYEEAITSYDKSLGLMPDSHKTWDNRGFSLDALGRYEEAISSYDRAIEFKPDDYEAWNNRGCALNELGRYEEAIASYDKAIESKPDYQEAWHNRGIALVELGRYKEAVDSYNQAIEFKPDYQEAWYNRGIVLVKLGRNEEAIDSYDKAIEFKPDDYEAWNNRGCALNELGRYEEAISSFDKAIELKPDSLQAWQNRSNSLSGLGRYEEAIATYDKVIEMEPNLIAAWRGRGISLRKLGRYQEAIDSFRKAIELRSDPDAAQFIRSILSQRLNRLGYVFTSWLQRLFARDKR